MILRPYPRVGKCGIKEIKAIHQRFINYHWKELIKLQKSASSKGCSQGDKELQHKAVLRLIKCGELSRAAKILTSKGLADPSDETINKLN